MEALQETRIFSIIAVRNSKLSTYDFSSFNNFELKYFITVPPVYENTPFVVRQPLVEKRCAQISVLKSSEG
jgi:hypothetical protein